MTGLEGGALTVAGQWRSFTAFPSILAIAVVNYAAAKEQPLCHGTIFHDINFITGLAARSQKTGATTSHIDFTAGFESLLCPAFVESLIRT